MELYLVIAYITSSEPLTFFLSKKKKLNNKIITKNLKRFHPEETINNVVHKKKQNTFMIILPTFPRSFR